MFFEDDIVVVVVEEDGDGAELCGGATRLRNLVRLQEVDLQQGREIQLMFTISPDPALEGGHRCTDHLLDEGVVCSVHAGAQRIKTLSITVVG